MKYSLIILLLASTAMADTVIVQSDSDGKITKKNGLKKIEASASTTVKTISKENGKTKVVEETEKVKTVTITNKKGEVIYKKTEKTANESKDGQKTSDKRNDTEPDYQLLREVIDSQ